MGGASAVALGGFVATAFAAFNWQPELPSIGATWPAFLSATLLRVVLLSTAGAVALFCVRVFRAYLHTNQLNHHRQRVANSMESFVESAITPEQRDAILGRLVEAVVAFGNSGLIPGDDDTVAAQKSTTDVVAKLLSGVAKPPAASGS